MDLMLFGIILCVVLCAILYENPSPHILPHLSQPVHNGGGIEFAYAPDLLQFPTDRMF